MKITYEDVKVACEQLSSQGLKCTANKVRDITGKGSNSTILTHIKKWEQQNLKANLRIVNSSFSSRERKHLQISVKLLSKTLYSLIALIFVVFLTRYLILESEANYDLFGQSRPFEMAVLTEVGLLLCAFARPDCGFMLVAVKLAMVGIVVFMCAMMAVGVADLSASNEYQRGILNQELIELRRDKISTEASIIDTQARSRNKEASTERSKLAQTRKGIFKALEDKKKLTVTSEEQEMIMIAFRIGAILLNVLMAHLLVNLWCRRTDKQSLFTRAKRFFPQLQFH